MNPTFKKVYPPFDPSKNRRKSGLLVVAGIPLPTFKPEDVPFFFRSTWPQYRKVVIVDGVEEEACLDGTETDETVIVKWDPYAEYNALAAKALKQILEK